MLDGGGSASRSACLSLMSYWSPIWNAAWCVDLTPISALCSQKSGRARFCGRDGTWNGWGRRFRLPKTDYYVRAGLMPVTEQMNRRLRNVTGIQDSVLNYGTASARHIPEVAAYSNNYKEKVTIAA